MLEGLGISILRIVSHSMRKVSPLAVELAVTLSKDHAQLALVLAVAFFLVSVFFVHKSFYGMRIETKESN